MIKTAMMLGATALLVAACATNPGTICNDPQNPLQTDGTCRPMTGGGNGVPKGTGARDIDLGIHSVDDLKDAINDGLDKVRDKFQGEEEVSVIEPEPEPTPGDDEHGHGNGHGWGHGWGHGGHGGFGGWGKGGSKA